MSDQPMRETERLRELIAEVWAEHRDPLSDNYKACQHHECAWCHGTREALQRLAAVEQERDEAREASRSWRAWLSFVLTDNGPAVQSLSDEDFKRRICEAWDAREGRAQVIPEADREAALAAYEQVDFRAPMSAEDNRLVDEARRLLRLSETPTEP